MSCAVLEPGTIGLLILHSTNELTRLVDAPIVSVAIFVDLIQGLAMGIVSHLYKIGEIFVKYCPFDNCNRPILKDTLGQIIHIVQLPAS